MFEIFEPLIRHHFGKILAFATVGIISSSILTYQLLTGIFKYMLSLIF